MSLKKTYYEILGIPRTATPEQIKRRYRRLARRHHPDVAEDKVAARRTFVQITEAYQVLMNPDKRVIYDASLDAEIVGTRPASARPSASPKYRTTTRTTRAPSVSRLISDAETAFVRGQFRSATSACREAIKRDRRNVRAHVILGDVCRIQGRADEAISMYTVALQLDPRNSDAMSKLEKLTRRSRSGRPSGISDERRQALKVGVSLIGGSVGTFVLFMFALSPGQPVDWLSRHLPFIGTWSATLLTVLATTGALAGFVLSVNESVRPLDDELVFQTVQSPGGRTAYPIGLLLILFNFFNFYAAAATYVVVSLIQESLSVSVMKVFVATFVLVVVTSMLYSPGPMQVFLFGGNVIFPAMLLGWVIGDTIKPGW